jgi:hypothetical protein
MNYVIMNVRMNGWMMMMISYIPLTRNDTIPRLLYKYSTVLEMRVTMQPQEAFHHVLYCTYRGAVVV